MKVLIVDDERLARREMRALLADYPDMDVVGEAGDVDSALALIAAQEPDLLFLDIQMPGKNGFELIEELGPGPLVIFVTAFDQHAVQAFETSAIDYLLKPVEAGRLQVAIARARQDYAARDSSLVGLQVNDKVFLKDGDRCWYVRLGDIALLESLGNYTRVHIDRGQPLIRRSLNLLESRLPTETFFRASRGFIVNLNHVEQVQAAVNGNLEFVLRTGATVELSRRQSQLFRDSQAL